MESHFEEFIAEQQVEIGPIWKRILAFILDFLIYSLIGYVMGIFFGTPNGEGGYRLRGLPAFIMFGIGISLWPISEALSGQTIGKRILKIKVVSNSNEKISIGQAIGRNLLGIVDYMLLLGLIVSNFNKKNKRIGDLAAKTIVINNYE